MGGVSDDLKAFYARQMEVYSGYSENADYNVGRVIDAIDGLGELDNTLIVWIWGDNGASMEGTTTGSFNELTMQNGIPLTDEMQLQLSERYGGLDQWGAAVMDPHYSAAWAWAGATPFQWGKQVGSHFGGTRNPMVVHWPAHIKDRGGLRTPFTHVIDVAPTILDVVGIPEPSTVDGIAQEPMHGSSFSASLSDGAAPEHRTQQYFETVGNRAMYKDGWWLAMKTERIPWDLTPEALAPFAPGVWDPDSGPAELYYLPDDFSQARDLAADNPEKVQELKDLFWEEAERYKVLPLLAALSAFFGVVPPIAEDTVFEFRGDVQNILSGMIPRIYNRSYTITADLVVPEKGVEGVIVAEADHLGGFTLYVKEGKLTHTYSMMGVFVYTQVAEEDLPTGEITVRMEFLADAAKPATGGDVTLFVTTPGHRAAGDHAARADRRPECCAQRCKRMRRVRRGAMGVIYVHGASLVPHESSHPQSGGYAGCSPARVGERNSSAWGRYGSRDRSGLSFGGRKRRGYDAVFDEMIGSGGGWRSWRIPTRSRDY